MFSFVLLWFLPALLPRIWLFSSSEPAWTYCPARLLSSPYPWCFSFFCLSLFLFFSPLLLFSFSKRCWLKVATPKVATPWDPKVVCSSHVDLPCLRWIQPPCRLCCRLPAPQAAFCSIVSWRSPLYRRPCSLLSMLIHCSLFSPFLLLYGGGKKLGGQPGHIVRLVIRCSILLSQTLRSFFLVINSTPLSPCFSPTSWLRSCSILSWAPVTLKFLFH